MSKVCRSSAEHYVWGTGCDGWHLLRSGALSVIEERMPPDTKEERHSHKQARQLFYTLEGELEMEVEGSCRRCAPERRWTSLPDSGIRRVIGAARTCAFL